MKLLTQNEEESISCETEFVFVRTFEVENNF